MNTHANKAAEEVSKAQLEWLGFSFDNEETEQLADLITTHAINPAVDEATKERDEVICKLLEWCKEYKPMTRNGTSFTAKTIALSNDITAAEKLLEGK